MLNVFKTRKTLLKDICKLSEELASSNERWTRADNRLSNERYAHQIESDRIKKELDIANTKIKELEQLAYTKANLALVQKVVDYFDQKEEKE